jgi:HEAT repeat protein
MKGTPPKTETMKLICFALGLLILAAPASAQQLRFDDVVRNLRNPDPKVRISAVKLLRDAKYPEAVAPIAPLVADPVDDIQLEAIAAELSFFLGQDLKSKRMVGFLVERRRSAIAEGAFELGPLVVWPRPVPAELVTSLLQAVDDENPKVRLEAIYALGVVAKKPLTAEQTALLVKALDHYDAPVRAAAARVIGRLELTEAFDALLKAVNDSQADVRYAAMRALGALRDERAVGALTEQFAFYKKGEGAFSALDALARIGNAASVPLFKERLQDRDAYIRRAAVEGLGRAGDASAIETLERFVNTDESAMVRIATAFALQKLGRPYAARIADLMSSSKVMLQGQEYLVELGPPVAPALLPRLQEPDRELREAFADVLGVVGDESAIDALNAAAAKDAGTPVETAAKRAVARIRSPSR